MRNDLERIMTLEPAYDRSDEGYGTHCVSLRMVVKGPLGATQFVLYTGWFLPDTLAAWREANAPSFLRDPLPADVGYHSPLPMYDGHEPMIDECKFVDGPCYYDGSGLRAKDWFEQKLLTGGSEAVWEALEEEYTRLFEED